MSKMKTYWVVTCKYENGEFQGSKTKVVELTGPRPEDYFIQDVNIAEPTRATTIHVQYFSSEADAKQFINMENKLTVKQKRELFEYLALASCVIFLFLTLLYRNVNVPMFIVTLFFCIILGHFEKNAND